MTQSNPPTNPEPSNAPVTPKLPRKRRRFLWVIGILFPILVLLILLAPTIASLSPVKNYVVGKVNERLNGRLEVGGYSVGWFTPIAASGIKLYDDQNRLIADVPNVKLHLTLLSALRQNFALGDDNHVDVASFVLNVDENHHTNFENLLKTEPKTDAKIKVDHSGEKKPDGKLPDISGKIALNFAGTVEGTGVPKSITVDPSSAVVSITDINKPIENTVKLAYRVGDAQPSTLAMTGTVDAIENNLLNFGGLGLGQDLSFGNLSLAGLEPFLSLAGKPLKLNGFVTGGIKVKAINAQPTEANGKLEINGLQFGGGPLKDSVVSEEKVEIPVNLTVADVGGVRTLVFSDVGITSPDINAKITGQVSQTALENISRNLAPGGEGSLTISVNVTNLPRLANSLHSALNLQADAKISGGSLTESLTITVHKESVSFAQSFAASAQGTSGGKPIEVKPIAVNASAEVVPNGTDVPAVNHLKLAVNSAFANVTGGGDSLAKLGITGNFDLNKMYAEAVQFTDLGAVKLAGSGTFAVTSSGDLTDDKQPITANATAAIQNVQVSGITASPINADRLNVAASGLLMRNGNEFEKIDKGYASLGTGDQSRPSLYAEASGIYDLKKHEASWFQVKTSASDLATLQHQYGGFVSALSDQQWSVQSGTLYAEAAGSYVNHSLTLARPAYFNLGGLTVLKGSSKLLSNDAIHAAVLATVQQNDSSTHLTISQLDAKSDSGLFSLSKGGDAPFDLERAGSSITGGGTLLVSADIKRVADLANAFSGVAVAADNPQVTGGKLNGTLSVAQSNQTRIDFKGALTALSVIQSGKPILANEQLNLAASGVAPVDTKSAEPVTCSATVDSAFAKMNVSNAKLNLAPNATGLDKLVSAEVTSNVPDLGKLASLLNAISPMLGTLNITSGNADLKLTVSRDTDKQSTHIDLSQCQIANLGLARGQRTYRFDSTAPISLKLDASVQQSPTINAVKLNSLSGDLRVASLSMAKPIFLSMETGKPATMEGAISVKGSLADATPLLAVVQDADPLPYAGNYDVTQTIGNKSDVTSLDGSIDVTNFQVLDAATKKPAITEPKLSIKNVVALDLAKHSASVNIFTLLMPQSQALGLNFTGQVKNFDKDCLISGISGPDAQLDLTYDADKLWQLVKPMLSVEMQTQYKDLKVAGKYTKIFKVSGTYKSVAPNLSATQRLAGLKSSGSFAIDLLDLPQGLTIKSFDLPFTLEKGILRTQAATANDARKLAPGADGKPRVANTAICNDGALNLDGMAIELGYADPLLSIERKHVLLNDVALNSVLADSLGHGNLIFKDAEQASGLLDVTIVDCKRVPLGDLITKKQNATAQVNFSVQKLALDSGPMSVISQALDLGNNGIAGSIDNGTITLSNGRVDSNFAINLDKTQSVKRSADQGGGRQSVTTQLPLAFGGGVYLAGGQLKDFAVNIPSALIPQKFLGNVDVAKLLPNGLIVPFTGTTAKYKFDFAGAVTKSVGNSLLGGGGDPQDALKNLGDLLGGGKKRKRSSDR